MSSGKEPCAAATAGDAQGHRLHRGETEGLLPGRGQQDARAAAASAAQASGVEPADHAHRGTSSCPGSHLILKGARPHDHEAKAGMTELRQVAIPPCHQDGYSLGLVETARVNNGRLLGGPLY